MGIAEAKRLRDAEATQHDVEAQQFLERGRHAQADGKLSLARTYYRMAVRRASPELRKEVLELLATLPVADSVPPLEKGATVAACLSVPAGALRLSSSLVSHSCSVIPAVRTASCLEGRRSADGPI